MDLIKIGLFMCSGLVLGLYIPKAAHRIILFKCMERDKDAPEFSLTRFYQLLVLFLNAALFTMAGWLMPLSGACVVSAFVFIALVAVIIDYYIRIICNEIVLLVLVLGIGYRFLGGGGIQALLSSLAALGFVLVIFVGAALLTKLLTRVTGVGAGDVKLAMAIAVTVGYSGVFYFLGGLALAIGGYCVLGLMYKFLTKKGTFAMCGHIMFGFIAALFIPYIPNIPF